MNKAREEGSCFSSKSPLPFRLDRLSDSLSLSLCVCVLSCVWPVFRNRRRRSCGKQFGKRTARGVTKEHNEEAKRLLRLMGIPRSRGVAPAPLPLPNQLTLFRVANAPTQGKPFNSM